MTNVIKIAFVMAGRMQARREEQGRRFAAAVKKRRKTWGLSQAKLAKLAGLSQATVAKLEQGRTLPSFYAVAAVADAVGLDLNDFRLRQVGDWKVTREVFLGVGSSAWLALLGRVPFPGPIPHPNDRLKLRVEGAVDRIAERAVPTGMDQTVHVKVLDAQTVEDEEVEQ